jgi:hypothetical protein
MGLQGSVGQTGPIGSTGPSPVALYATSSSSIDGTTIIFVSTDLSEYTYGQASVYVTDSGEGGGTSTSILIGLPLDETNPIAVSASGSLVSPSPGTPPITISATNIYSNNTPPQVGADFTLSNGSTNGNVYSFTINYLYT